MACRSRAVPPFAPGIALRLSEIARRGMAGCGALLNEIDSQDAWTETAATSG
jgi:hypothetical protein